MDKLLRIFSWFDWAMGVGSLALGLYLSNGWLIAGGVLGLLAAWYKPAQRVKARLEKKFLRRKPVTDDSSQVLAEDAFYAQVLGSAPAEPEHAASERNAPVQAPAPRTYGSAVSGYRAVYLSASRHNQLRATGLVLPVRAAAPTHTREYF